CPAWNAFADITRGSTTLGGMVRSNGMARRALEILDKRMDTSSGVGPAGRGVGKGERPAPEEATEVAEAREAAEAKGGAVAPAAEPTADVTPEAEAGVGADTDSGADTGTSAGRRVDASAKPEAPETPGAV
ncbi:geranylgeranyl reductase, partial [Streptomyces sp. SID6041]|nr:geranylgeranyl reductase [Streptomyces sp. SID6041]